MQRRSAAANGVVQRARPYKDRTGGTKAAREAELLEAPVLTLFLRGDAYVHARCNTALSFVHAGQYVCLACCETVWVPSMMEERILSEADWRLEEGVRQCDLKP